MKVILNIQGNTREVC